MKIAEQKKSAKTAAVISVLRIMVLLSEEDVHGKGYGHEKTQSEHEQVSCDVGHSCLVGAEEQLMA